MNVGRIRKVDNVRGCIELEDGVFTDKYSDVLVTSGLLEIVPIVKLTEEKLWLLVMMSIPHTASRYIDCVVEVRSVPVSFLWGYQILQWHSGETDHTLYAVEISVISGYAALMPLYKTGKRYGYVVLNQSSFPSST